MTHPIIEWIHQAGWNPDHPSDECRRAISRPRILSRLNRRDADGGHFIIAYMEYDRLLDGTDFSDADRHFMQLQVAAYVVQAFHWSSFQTIAAWDRARIRHELWVRDVWTVSGKHLDRALRSGRFSPLQLWLLREWYEPAYTVQESMNGRFFSMDFEADFRAMARGMIMHAEGRRRVRANPPLPSLESFMEQLDFVNTPEESASSYGPGGLLRIDEMLVKTRLDARLGRVNVASDEPLLELGRDEADHGLSVVDQVGFADLVRAVDEVAATRCAGDEGDHALEIVRRHFQDLLNRHTSVRQLRHRYGASREALQRAFDVLRARLQRRLA